MDIKLHPAKCKQLEKTFIFFEGNITFKKLYQNNTSNIFHFISYLVVAYQFGCGYIAKLLY
jgi:hypothetical protein